MDIIVKHFSKGVIAAVGFLFLVTMLFHTSFSGEKVGFLSSLLTNFNTAKSVERTQKGFATFKEQGSLAVPTITYQTNQPTMVVEETIDLKQYFKALDYKNDEIDFTVTDVYNSKKQKEESTFSNETKTLYFQKSGIYQIELKTKDSTNKTYVYRFFIPVERKELK